MASAGVQKCFQVSVNEIDTLIGSKQKNLNLMRNHFFVTFLILKAVVCGCNMTLTPYYPSNFSTIYPILMSFHGIYILLNGNFYQHNIQYTNILTAILQCTILMGSLRLMIISVIIRLILLFIYVINNRMVFTNDMCNSNNCKIIGNGTSESLNHVISMNNILFRRTYKNGTQVGDYASDDLNLDLNGLCIDYYDIKANCLHLYILFCVNNYQLNVYRYSGSTVKLKTNGIIIMTAIMDAQYTAYFIL